MKGSESNMNEIKILMADDEVRIREMIKIIQVLKDMILMRHQMGWRHLSYSVRRIMIWLFWI